MRGSEFVFDSIDLLHHNLHKIIELMANKVN